MHRLSALAWKCVSNGRQWTERAVIGFSRWTLFVKLWASVSRMGLLKRGDIINTTAVCCEWKRRRSPGDRPFVCKRDNPLPREVNGQKSDTPSAKIVQVTCCSKVCSRRWIFANEAIFVVLLLWFHFGCRRTGWCVSRSSAVFALWAPGCAFDLLP